METVLLHSCCAPCSGAILEWMLAHDVRPIVFYFNPNIFPEGEYRKRKDELTKHCAGLGVQVIDGDWDHGLWRRAVAGAEATRERGLRCDRCFGLRLHETAKKCRELGLARFATTLGSSRWKNLEQVHRAGRRAQELVPEVTYWEKNWRKDGLVERRYEIIREKGFYNQTWCGCEFSLYGSLRNRDKQLESAQRLRRIARIEAAGR